MLSRIQRLNAREFAVVFEHSQVLRHPLLQLRFYKHPDKSLQSDADFSSGKGQKSRRPKSATRAAFVAPKKLGNAVVRNGIRRRVRERYRILHKKEALHLHHLHQWESTLENCDLVFLATAQCATATSRQIDESLSGLLKRAANKVAAKN